MWRPPIEISDTIQEHDFDKLYRQETHPRLKMRFLAMAHLKEGVGYKKVAQMVRVHEKSVLSWIHRFNQDGLEGLKEKGNRGKRPQLQQSQYEDFKQAIIKAQTEMKGGRLMAEDARKILQEQFDIELSRSSVYGLLHKVGLSWVNSRSRHPKQDLQATFKKTLPH